MTVPCPGGGQWIDVDTPGSACVAHSHHDGRVMQLVFSDEFEVEERSFADGEDARWTALESTPFTNYQLNRYNASLARTRGGALELLFIGQDYSGSDHTRHFQSAMLQTWNKFCLSEGAVEISARLPGSASQPGLWPAFWLMGNLGRATFTASTDGFWPWTYEECSSVGSTLQCTNNASDCAESANPAQRISGCNAQPGYGFHPNQGRGAPEIDVIEAMPGSGTIDYDPSVHVTRPEPQPRTSTSRLSPLSAPLFSFTSLVFYPQCGQGCPTVAPARQAAAALTKPLISTSLIIAPGWPRNADQRPRPGCLPDVEAGQWYAGLGSSQSGNSTDRATGRNATTNYEFYGDFFADYADGVGVQTDALSVNGELGSTHFDDFHVYRVEWRRGAGGFIRWSIDGALQFEISQSLLDQTWPFSMGGQQSGTIGRRLIPSEPMYLILNIDSAPQWGMPTHFRGDAHCTECECCFDCARVACTRCIKVDPMTNLSVNVFAWFEEFCEMLPATYAVQWVRAYVPSGVNGNTSANASEDHGGLVGCSPPSHPTRRWIHEHEEWYRPSHAEAALLPIVSGGGSCSDDDGCGGSRRGVCASHSSCVCSVGWVGPHCLSQAAGSALDCRSFEDSMAALRAIPAVQAPEEPWL